MVVFLLLLLLVVLLLFFRNRGKSFREAAKSEARIQLSGLTFFLGFSRIFFVAWGMVIILLLIGLAISVWSYAG
jgi:hypothetical protein